MERGHTGDFRRGAIRACDEAASAAPSVAGHQRRDELHDVRRRKARDTDAVHAVSGDLGSGPRAALEEVRTGSSTCRGGTRCGFTGIPDGGFKTIGVPVPIHKLADVRACLDDLACDPEFRVPMGGRLDLRFGTVNHVTGRGPEWTEDPERLYVASFEASGFLPLGLPQLEHANDGSSAWTVRRLVYLASIEVPFAGVEFVVERLAEFGLVRRHGAGESAEPGVEFDAFVAPAGIELTSQSISWMDAQGARRVFYLLNSGDEPAKGDATRMMEALEQSAEDAVELIRQAVLVSGQQKRWLASLMRCEECEA